MLTMEYRKLGRSGVKVSPLCLGTMNFGRKTDESTAHRIMDAALDAGVNFFDTSNSYGRPMGTSEEIIGSWFVQGGERREKVVLATKVYGAGSDWPNTNRLSARHVREACEASLRRLKTDHIDLYQMHHVDRDTPWDEIWQAMELLVTQGKVLYVGSSNFAGWHLAQANEAAARRNFLGLVSEQSVYNLRTRTVELEVLPAAEDYGIGVIPWSPLGGGLLGGVLEQLDPDGRRATRGQQAIVEQNREQLEAWESLCQETGTPPSQVALAWLLTRPAVTAPIIGPRTMDQLTDALPVVDVDLDADVLARLDKIFPGPGPAPEAYAW